VSAPGGAAPPPVLVNSAIAGVTWPAIPAPHGAALLSLLFQLEQTQWWPAAEIARRQREQLRLLLRHARERVPFYATRLGDIADPPDEDAWWEGWRRIPPLRRAEIQAADATGALLAETLPPGHGECRAVHTSGSTGAPIRAVRSELWELIWSAFAVRDHLWHRRDLGGTLAAIRDSGAGVAPYPDGARAEGWSHEGAAILRTGPMASLNVATPVAQQAEWLQRQAATYLATHPSLALRLAEHCRERSLRLPALRQVITVAETLGPEVRRACRVAWDVPVIDIYSTREAGHLALQCPAQEACYHVQAEGVLVEVVDGAGRPCRPGEIGRVLVTPLHNFAMPLIRYEIGDYAEPGEPCPCGRGLPVLRRILGRRQNMLILPSGEERWPLLSSADVAALLAAAPPIRQYQLVQRALERIELRLAVARPLSGAEEAALTDWVRRKFRHPFAVSFAYFDELPPNAAGKFEDFLSEVARRD
jgi:phenylacetate-CoA ligase